MTNDKWKMLLKPWGTHMTAAWYEAMNIETVDSPALLFYPERIERNIRRTVEIARGAARLRPHVKTHKCPEVVRLLRAAGITKVKCATIAEAEMATMAGADDVLLAYQPIGPRAKRWAQLVSELGLMAQFACIVDNAATIRELAELYHPLVGPYSLFLDIDCGQGRTGVPAGPLAVDLYKQISADDRLVAAGLHVYDGHIHDTDLSERKVKCDDAFAPVEALRRELIAAGMSVPTIVAGGTPTFPIHAQRDASLGIEWSPGTNVLWDAGYAAACPDLDFKIAALVLTRVVSKPGAKRLCLDLGHKAIASERPHPRVIFPQLKNCEFISHSEEHLVVEAENAGDFKVGDALYGMPWHICPTVALYQEANVVRDGRVEMEAWAITARDRRITV
jgi:D-serine deaminase-like pyridoxal phosphate-dependent protein